MSAADVLVVRTGTANLASVMAGLRRAGATAELVDTPAAILDASRLVLPGVGSFGAAMNRLREYGLVDALRERIAAERPTLTICLGLQVLSEASEESPGVEGLGIFSGTIRRFPDDVIVPQLGWNRVEPASTCRLLTPGWAYYANSYRMTEVPAGWEAAFTDHGGRFVAAVERGPILACQFHPELSGPWGLELLQRWYRRGES